jgi:hypothetical protein
MDTLTEVAINPKDLKLVLQQSAEAFFHFNLGEALTQEIPPIHTSLWALLTNPEVAQQLFAIPRGFSKTTLAKLAVIYLFTYADFSFCVYVSSTASAASAAASDIMDFFRADHYQTLFGAVDIIKDSPSEGWFEFTIHDWQGKKKHCIIRSRGAGQQVRGLNQKNRRPDCAVVDDLEDNDNTNTPELQKKIDLWFYGPFIKCLAKNKKTKLIWIGNIIRKTTLLARRSKDAAWNPVVFGAMVFDKETNELQSLWPEMFPLSELLEDLALYRREGNTEIWMCEMMNMPGTGEAGFSAESVLYQNVGQRDDYIGTFITIDPAFSEKPESDDASVVCHGIRRTGQGQILEQETGRAREEDIYNIAVRMAQKWGAWTWGIEANAAQKLLIPLFSTYAASAGILNKINFVPVITTRAQSKKARIQAWVNSMESKDYAVPEDDIEITTAILNYDLTKLNQKDDLLDCCAMGLIMRHEYRDFILTPAELIKELEKAANPLVSTAITTELDHCYV